MIIRIKYFLLISIIFLITSCTKEPLDLNKTLVEKDGLYYKKDTKKLYSGPIFINYDNDVIKQEGIYKKGKKDGKFVFWYENGNMEKSG